MPDPTPRLTLGDLARQALAAAPAARTPLLVQLARATRTPEQLVAVADLLLAGGKHGPGVALEWLVRTHPAVPADLVVRVVPHLEAKAIPANLRVAAAARLIRDLPDKPDAIRHVVKGITSGLSPLRGIERLRHLQHQIEKGRALDHLIDRREQRVKVDCPRCKQRLPRVEMVKHLWYAHGLFLNDGKVLGADRLIEAQREAFAATGDPAALDRAALLAGDTRDTFLREWTAGSNPPAEDTAPLRAAAGEHRCGLCPACLTEVPEPLPPVPAPLAVADGRLAGDGYAVEVGGARWFRSVRVTTPEKVLKAGPDRRARMVSPRGLGTILAALVLLGAAAAALTLPRELAPPFPVAVGGSVLAAAVYGVVCLYRRPLAPPDDRAVDAAWSVLGRRFLQRDTGTRFLTRLCRSSVGRGGPVERVAMLNKVVERARKTADESNAALHLLAAARVLQVEDAGRDRLAGIAALAAEAFRGDLPAGFAEHVVTCFEPRDATDAIRLKMLLIAAAFDGGLRPRDLIDLWGVAPGLRKAMAVEPLHRLGLLYGLWALRNIRRWEKVGKADSVFDLARGPVGGRFLRQFPDLLLAHDLDPDSEADLGPVLVCGRGVAVGGAMVSNPDAEIRVVKGPRGGFELVYGRHRLRMEHRPPDGFAEKLRGWLQLRATVLLPYIDGYLEPGSPDVTNRVLGPFRRSCWRCGTVSGVAVGKIGTPVPARG
jgi:hypothetical protein